MTNVALVAHDGRKDLLVAWAGQHRHELSRHYLVATASTATLLQDHLGLAVAAVESGPLGGDQQIGAMIAEHRLDALIFFQDPLAVPPHEADVRALLRLYRPRKNCCAGTGPAPQLPDLRRGPGRLGRDKLHRVRQIDHDCASARRLAGRCDMVGRCQDSAEALVRGVAAGQGTLLR